MNCTIITPSMGALNGASQSAVDLALACAQTYENLSIIYKHKSKIPETIDGYSFKSIEAYQAARNQGILNEKNEIQFKKLGDKRGNRR